jgi:methionine-S-sulfoxide reductase
MNNKNLNTIILGGGCFWCLEAVYKQVKGITTVISGYAGGDKKNPNYEQVLTGSTGHAEVVKITYNPKIIPLKTIFDIFFNIHNPTTLNRQRTDIGSQYRSIILFTSDYQKKLAYQKIYQLEKQKVYNKQIVTELKPLKQFYPAEEYHQNYYANNLNKPFCQMVINSKLKKLKQEFKQYVKKSWQ